MKTFFKILAISCILALVVTCFAACGNKDIYGPANKPDSSSKDDTVSAPESSETQGTEDSSNVTSGGSSSGSSGDAASSVTDGSSDTSDGSSSTTPSDTSSGETTIEGDHGPIIPF